MLDLSCMLDHVEQCVTTQLGVLIETPPARNIIEQIVLKLLSEV